MSKNTIAKGLGESSLVNATYSSPFDYGWRIQCTLIVSADVDYGVLNLGLRARPGKFAISGTCHFTCIPGEHIGCCCGTDGTFSIEAAGIGKGIGNPPQIDSTDIKFLERK